MSANRRDFIKFIVAGSIAAGCPVDLPLLAADAAPGALVDGDHYEVCHQVRDGHGFPSPPISKKYDVVIVGGGISGLSAAYFMRARDFLLLEKEPHWGGNAYLEEYQGQAYATGSAYAERGSDADQLMKELGVTLLPVNCPDPTIVNGKWVANTWGTGLDELPYPPSVRESFKKFRKDMLAVDVTKNPAHYDSESLAQYLKAYAPEVKQWWDAYGLSNWGADSDNTSALVAIGDFHAQAVEAKDDTRVTLPGGNGVISQQLAKILLSTYGDRMQTGAAIVSVEQEKTGVRVTYSQNGKLASVGAKFVIMATPKFITARIVSGLPEPQSEAMLSFRYCPYPVVNMIFEKPLYTRGYDTWCPGNAFTDFIVADWVLRAQPGYKPNKNILSFYTPLPESQRYRMLEVSGCRIIAANVLRDFQKLLPEFQADPVEIHFYRRGHPMFVPAPGTFTRTIPAANPPMDRIFFANTDSVGPVSDSGSAVQIARRASEWVAKRMAGASASAASAAVGRSV